MPVWGFWWHRIFHKVRRVHTYVGDGFTVESYLCKKCGAAWEIRCSRWLARDHRGGVRYRTMTVYKRLDPEEVKKLKKFREEVAEDVATL